MFGNLGKGNNERISGIIALYIGPYKTGTIQLQKRKGLSLVNLGFLETDLGKPL